MGKTRRQKKMRGGGKGQVQIIWTYEGKEDFDLNGMLSEWDEEGGEEWDTVGIANNIKDGIENHVVEAGYTKDDRHPSVDPTLGFVDVVYEGEPAQIPQFEVTFPGPDGSYTLTAEFDIGDLESDREGGKRKKRSKKSRATRKRRHTRRR